MSAHSLESILRPVIGTEGRQRQNSGNAATYIPAEVGIRIFLMLIHTDFERRFYVGEREEGLGWIFATHVCRQWRNIATGSPSLWRRPIFNIGLRWTEEMLARSRGSTLFVKSTPQMRVSQPAAHLLFENLDRIKSLHIEARNPYLHSLLDNPAPSLEDLKITLTSENLPAELFSGHAPCLRHITLSSRIPIPWSSPLFPGLVSFCVANEHLRAPCTLDDILDGLEGMVMLKSLALHGCLPNFPIERPFPTRTIQLPHIQTLSLQGSLSGCISLGEHLDFPACGFKLRVMCGRLDSAANFWALMALAERAAASRRYSHLRFTSYKPEGLLLKAWTYPDQDDATQLSNVDLPSHLPDLDIIIRSRFQCFPVMSTGGVRADISPVDYRSDMIQDLLSVLSLEHARALDIACMCDIVYLPTWLSVLSPAMHLRSLTVYHITGLCALSMSTADGGQTWQGLNRNITKQGRAARRTFSFPRLSTLRITSVDFACWVPGESGRVSQMLPRWLVARKACATGCPIERVVLDRCVVFFQTEGHAFMDELKLVVPVVEVID
ncbi:hypothetical protein BC834DRAFT_971485 [Gloeopeniophorella convolvens]|nr:hypothetical protein BC834DRAFT_971485 [Gloeopeniophorella convolvens]